MSNIVKNLIELIGNTPLMEISNFSLLYNVEAEILVKVESFNPLGSVKDRTAYAMITAAEEKGVLNKCSVIIEPTSGNTGIGLAYISAIKGYKLILTMPETMSIERRKLLSALGAEIVLTPGDEGMSGAIKKAEQLLNENENAFNPDQFGNPANPAFHKITTAQEIINDTDGKIDFFVAGVGTGGTITGIGEALKEHDNNIKIVAVEPFNSAVLSGEVSGKHGLQGIGAGFIPSVLNLKIIDEIVKVNDNDAINTAKELGKTDGILTGISSGAALYAAVQVAKRPENKGKRIVVLLPDTGERYLSTDLFS